MVESCSACPEDQHKHLPLDISHFTYATFEHRHESPPWNDRVNLLQVSPCVTPHVANQNMTGNETIYTSKIFLVLMRNLRRTMK